MHGEAWRGSVWQGSVRYGRVSLIGLTVGWRFRGLLMCGEVRSG